MTHYVMCPILFALNCQFCPGTPACPLQRLGLKQPHRDSILLVACMFAGYHAVKRRSHSLSITNDTLSIQQRFKCHEIYADFFWAEALDNGFSCKHFRPDIQSSTSLQWDSSYQDDLSVPTDTSRSSAIGTEIRFVAGEDFQWLHVGLATGS